MDDYILTQEESEILSEVIYDNIEDLISQYYDDFLKFLEQEKR